MPRNPEDIFSVSASSLSALRASTRAQAHKPIKDYWKAECNPAQADQDKHIDVKMVNQHGDALVLRGKTVGPQRYIELYNGVPTLECLVVRFCVNNHEIYYGENYAPAIGHDEMGNRVGVSKGVLGALKELFSLTESSPALVKNDRYQDMVRPIVEDIIKTFKDV